MCIKRHYVRAQILRRYVILAVASVFTFGCGESEKLGQITGTITIKGELATSGSVVYENRERSISVRANLDEAGQYRIRTHDRNGLPPGSYQVAVTSTRVGSGASPLVGGTALAQEPEPPVTGPAIPEKYQKVATSGLSAEIVQGANVKDFDLE